MFPSPSVRLPARGAHRPAGATRVLPLAFVSGPASWLYRASNIMSTSIYLFPRWRVSEAAAVLGLRAACNPPRGAPGRLTTTVRAGTGTARVSLLAVPRCSAKGLGQPAASPASTVPGVAPWPRRPANKEEAPAGFPAGAKVFGDGGGAAPWPLGCEDKAMPCLGLACLLCISAGVRKTIWRQRSACMASMPEVSWSCSLLREARPARDCAPQDTLPTGLSPRSRRPPKWILRPLPPNGLPPPNGTRPGAFSRFQEKDPADTSHFP